MGKRKMFTMKDLRGLKDTDIQTIGNVYETWARNIKPEVRLCYFIDTDELEDEESIDQTIITHRLDDMIDTDECNCCDFDEEEFLDTIKSILKEENHYLVVALQHNWNNQDGIKFVDNIKQVFTRNYECEQYFTGMSRGHKVVTFTEYHHDKPTGSQCIAISLNDTEYNKLVNMEIGEVIDYGKALEKLVNVA